ncbi:MAG: hypothetical protein A2X34_05465 [Elusimicrobia bacterium GWC2_51_8]|nr:MAG: hypothetical protein A2X33_01745 [Elusimicrobia bacterium GWA2_51_34]OGR62500.1 MAG: hypothetical protein A2X34_05465 [Elusimicrobia bacterium GWC2_51_8]OGR86195.1 MAG: hypothetical protein A2021_03480 [Elusimicrobia bacterium GWF2_52_66]HAF96250.1 hypothetical protein [Elusimicrobiota bacterium]HCE97860.1 hypothetical protein [Elusimicrobiota bacterium]
MKKLFTVVLLCLPCLGFSHTPEELRLKGDNYSLSAADLKIPPAAVSAAQPAAVGTAVPVFDYLSSLNRADGASVSISRSGGSIIIEGFGKIPKSAYSDAYKNGDVVFLIGHLEDALTEREWTAYYNVAKWLVKEGFRVVMNPVAMVADIKASVQDDRTKVIIWSSHGSKDGGIYDSSKELVPTDVFAMNPGRNFKQIIVSSCYSNVMVGRYQFPAGVNSTYWEGTTDSDDLFSYLFKRWDPRGLGENVE